MNVVKNSNEEQMFAFDQRMNIHKLSYFGTYEKGHFTLNFKNQDIHEVLEIIRMVREVSCNERKQG